jgi:hypothetical protein
LATSTFTQENAPRIAAHGRTIRHRPDTRRVEPKRCSNACERCPTRTQLYAQVRARPHLPLRLGRLLRFRCHRGLGHPSKASFWLRSCMGARNVPECNSGHCDRRRTTRARTISGPCVCGRRGATYAMQRAAARRASVAVQLCRCRHATAGARHATRIGHSLGEQPEPEKCPLSLRLWSWRAWLLAERGGCPGRNTRNADMCRPVAMKASALNPELSGTRQM